MDMISKAQYEQALSWLEGLLNSRKANWKNIVSTLKYLRQYEEKHHPDSSPSMKMLWEQSKKSD
jgi:hypothetical protein